MKNSNIGFGIFLVSIGILWVLISAGILDWSILQSLADLWPLLLIAIGLNIVFKERPIGKLIIWVCLIATLGIYGYVNEPNTTKNYVVVNKPITIEKTSGTTRGELDISLGGVEFGIKNTDSNLVEGTSNIGDLNYKNEISGDKSKVVFSRNNLIKGFNIFKMDKVMNENNFDLNINEDVVWDIDVDLGAVKGIVDMSKLKVENFYVDMGAGKLDLIFGKNVENVNVKVSAGASALDAYIPKEVGVKITMDGALNNTNFISSGFTKSNDVYLSPNYEDSKYKIDMDIEIGVGSFNIHYDDNSFI